MKPAAEDRRLGIEDVLLARAAGQLDFGAVLRAALLRAADAQLATERGPVVAHPHADGRPGAGADVACQQGFGLELDVGRQDGRGCQGQEQAEGEQQGEAEARHLVASVGPSVASMYQRAPIGLRVKTLEQIAVAGLVDPRGRGAEQLLGAAAGERLDQPEDPRASGHRLLPTERGIRPSRSPPLRREPRPGSRMARR